MLFFVVCCLFLELSLSADFSLEKSVVHVQDKKEYIVHFKFLNFRMKVEEKGCFVHMIQNSKYISPGSKINKNISAKNCKQKKIP